MSERDQRVNGRSSDSRKQDSEHGRNSERGDRAKIGVEIPWADTEKKLFEKSRNGYCAGEPHRKSDRDQPQSLADDETHDVDGFGAQSSTDRQLLGPLSHEISQEAENADCGEQHGHRGECADQSRAKPWIGQRIRKQFLHSLESNGHCGICVVQERAERACNRLFVQRCPNKNRKRTARSRRRREEDHRLRRLTWPLPAHVGDYPDNLPPWRLAVHPNKSAQRRLTWKRGARQCLID